MRLVERDELRDRAAHRHPREMRPAEAEDVDQRPRVGHEVATRVGRRARLVADRAARVPVVVAHREPPARRETLAQLVLPPVHRGPRPHDQQDRGVAHLAEALHAEVDAVRVDDAFG